MPLIRNNTIGAKIIASAKTARRFTMTVAAGATSTQAIVRLPVSNLSQVFYYAQMTAGPPGVTYTPQFAVDNFDSGAALPEPDWFDLTVPQVLVLNVPFFVTERINANMASAVLVVPGGGAGAVVEMIIAASQ